MTHNTATTLALFNEHDPVDNVIFTPTKGLAIELVTANNVAEPKSVTIRPLEKF